MGGLVAILTVFVVGCFILAWKPRPMKLPAAPHPPKALFKAKRRFISEMNRRIFREPQISPQLQTQRDMVVGWYELKGPVTGVRFVAKACCQGCSKLDGREFSLLDVSFMVRYMPPIHQEGSRWSDCCCTLLPVTVGAEPARGRASTPSGRGALRSVPVGRR